MVELPKPVLASIFAKLDVKEACRFRRVCWLWHRASEYNSDARSRHYARKKFVLNIKNTNFAISLEYFDKHKPIITVQIIDIIERHHRYIPTIWYDGCNDNVIIQIIGDRPRNFDYLDQAKRNIDICSAVIKKNWRAIYYVHDSIMCDDLALLTISSWLEQCDDDDIFDIYITHPMNFNIISKRSHLLVRIYELHSQYIIYIPNPEYVLVAQAIQRDPRNFIHLEELRQLDHLTREERMQLYQIYMDNISKVKNTI